MSTLSRFIPGVRIVATYRASWLRQDVVAGLVLTTLLVPQGMAYAELAGLPAITGLYTSVLCLLGYALFGPSRILVLGPDSSLGPMIAATLIPIIGSNGDPERAIELASMLALLVGAITIFSGIFKLGFVADLLSKPTQIGYMNGLALTILVSQLSKLCGFSVEGAGRGRRRHRARVSHGHDLHLLGLRGTHRPGGRRQPRDDRYRGGERRRSVLPGLPGEHPRLAHSRGRAGGREDADHRPGRRRGDRADARARARPPQEPAESDPGRSGDRGVAVTRRHRRGQAPL